MDSRPNDVIDRAPRKNTKLIESAYKKKKEKVPLHLGDCSSCEAVTSHPHSLEDDLHLAEWSRGAQRNNNYINDTFCR